MKCVKCFFPSNQYSETCYTYYGAQTALAIKPSNLPRGYPLNREVSFGYNDLPALLILAAAEKERTHFSDDFTDRLLQEGDLW